MVMGWLALLQNYHKYFSAIYDIPIEPVTYTGSENMYITTIQILLIFTIKINGGIVMHPRSGGRGVCIFKCMLGLHALFLQNINDGAQPIAIFNSLDQSCEFFWDADTPNSYDRNSIDNLIATIYVSNHYNKTEIYTIVADQTHTGSENIGITNNQISLNCPMKINDEIVMHPRAYGIQFDMYAGTSGFASSQNQQDGGQPIAVFNSLGRSCELFGDDDIPSFYKKTEIRSILANQNFSDPNGYYNQTEIDAIVPNINFSNNHYTTAEIYDTVNELSTLILNTYTKTEVDNLLYTSYPSLSLIAGNFYATPEMDSMLSAYTHSAPLHIDLYSKVKTHLILDTYTTTIQPC